MSVRHISECISEWFTDYQEAHMKIDPFNLPDALEVIRAELCTCPVAEPLGLQVHHPHCGHPSWTEEDA